VEAQDVTGTTANRWIAKLGVGLLAFGGALVAVGTEPARLGLIYDEVAQRPGTLETVGRPLASGDLVKALSTGAMVRLDNGHVLKLSPNSSALIEAGQAGEVSVTVLSGRVSMVDEAGRPHLAGQRSRFTLSPTRQDADAAEERLLRLDPARVHRDDEPRRPAGPARGPR
jgi:hypothetical protein